MNYRAEIDGLRALAVIPVIFFHAGFSFFGGGFVGVDVFFVISGYLITNIIINEISQDKFSIINFYERRARRILPALFFVMLVTLPLAWFWLPPLHLKDFGQSLVAVSLFSSNFLFWTESGYFTGFAELKPLLHTWSLAVEEQYYILFPVFLMLTWRLGVKVIIYILFAVFLMSLFLAHLASTNSQPNIVSASFLFLPTRGWELLIGVFVAFYLKNNGFFQSNLLNQALSFIGFILVGYSIASYDASTPFPSLYALVPTLGTALLILFALPGTIIYRLLSCRLFVGIGLISFSAYLWHQPIFAFTRYYFSHGEIPTTLILLLCLMSLILAYISWRWVEKPFRDKTLTSRKFIFQFSFISMFLFIAIGLFIHFTDGLKTYKVNYEFSETERSNYLIVEESTNYDLYNRMVDSDCNMWVKNIDKLNKERLEICGKLHGQPLMLLGDSHALNIYNIFAKSNKYPFLIGIAEGGCRPHDNLNHCSYDNLLKLLKQDQAFKPKIIFHQSGAYFLIGTNGKNKPSYNDKYLYFDQENVKKVIHYLLTLEALGVEVTWLGPFTEYGIDPIINFKEIKNIPVKNFKIFSNLETDIHKVLDKSGFVNYISFSSFYKIEEEVVVDNCLLWRDPDHFSYCGESYISSISDFTVFE